MTFKIDVHRIEKFQNTFKNSNRVTEEHLQKFKPSDRGIAHCSGYLKPKSNSLVQALLRLPQALTRAEKCAAVDDIIDTFGLNKCADTTINLLSGGEKKRVNGIAH